MRIKTSRAGQRHRPRQLQRRRARPRRESQAGSTPAGWVGSAVNEDPDPPAYSARVWVVCASP